MVRNLSRFVPTIQRAAEQGRTLGGHKGIYTTKIAMHCTSKVVVKETLFVQRALLLQIVINCCYYN